VHTLKGNGSPHSIAERRVPELIPILGSQPAGAVSHKPGSRLPLLFARPAVTLTTLKRAATNFAFSFLLTGNHSSYWSYLGLESDFRREPFGIIEWARYFSYVPSYIVIAKEN